MNAKIRISLVGLLAITLLLAVAAPAFARTTGTSCGVRWLGVNKDGEDVELWVEGRGEVEFSGNIATVSCEGTIRLDEKIYSYTLYDLDEMREYLYNKYGAVIGIPFIFDSDDMGEQMSHDFKGEGDTSEYWELIVHENGNYNWEALYDLSDD